jgi:hypothetical protein
MEENLVLEIYIPLDKSWIIRMGILDLVNGYDTCINFLRKEQCLNEDLGSLLCASEKWGLEKEITVGESGTLYRFLKYASWKLGADKKFILEGTLRNRSICDDSSIINWPLEKLLTLDNGTSQWASASVLLGNDERIENPPYKLQVTFDAVQHWEQARKAGKTWVPRYDETIKTQASAYLNWLRTGRMNFEPQQAEDYCFARAFGLMTSEEGEAKWPSLRGHESDRIAEMEIALQQSEVTSKDHRVVQAIAMRRNSAYGFINPDCVRKSWPKFWEFLKDSPKISHKYF